jgi:hypothetical protein
VTNGTPTRPSPVTTYLSSEGHLTNATDEDQHRVEDEARSKPVSIQASKLAKTYTNIVKLSDPGKVCAVITNAQNAGYTDDRIKSALERLAHSSRPVTADTLRIEIDNNGNPPTKTAGRSYFGKPGEGKSYY